MPAAEVRAAAAAAESAQHPAELLWNLIIRPPRSRYDPAQLGPMHFCVGQGSFARRTDLELRNPRGHALKCSLFEPLPRQAWEASRRASDGRSAGRCDSAVAMGPGSEAGAAVPMPGPGGAPGQRPLPCVVFLHGNASSRLEALPLVPQIMPLGISLFCFDFSGCGMSEGEYISLGWFEQDDLAACIEHLRTLGRVSRVALWGRSMGAFTALMYADRDPTIAGLALDSPFSSLKVLAEELAWGYAKVPAWMVSAVLVLVRAIIQAKADFDIEHLDALKHVSHSFSPALFLAAHQDDFILPDHARRLHRAYQGEKELYMINGDHFSARPKECQKKIILFLCRAFHCAHLDRLLEMHASGLYDIFAGPPRHLGTNDPGGRCDDGAILCQQMQIFPALKLMMLVRQTQCHRPFFASASIKLLEEHSEAGFFVRLEPAAVTENQSQPRFFVLTVSAVALVASQIRDDALETVAVAGGLPPRQSGPLQLGVDRAGCMSLRLGKNLPLEFPFRGAAFRQEVTLWLMLLKGQSSFSSLAVEDSEATLCEGLGDSALQHRHLGGAAETLGPPCPAAPNGCVLRPGSN